MRQGQFAVTAPPHRAEAITSAKTRHHHCDRDFGPDVVLEGYRRPSRHHGQNNEGAGRLCGVIVHFIGPAQSPINAMSVPWTGHTVTGSQLDDDLARGRCAPLGQDQDLDSASRAGHR
jgi:hypothetical protein